MFPNVRLMIAAMFVSVFALSCGFGVFAEFRVNHEPLVRLPAVSGPLQLAANYAAPLLVAASTRSSFDARTLAPEPPSGAVATDAVMPKLAFQESVPQDAMPQKSTPQESTPQESTPQESAPQESAPQDAAPRGEAEPSAPVAVAPPETAPASTPDVVGSITAQSLPQNTQTPDSGPDANKEAATDTNKNALDTGTEDAAADPASEPPATEPSTPDRAIQGADTTPETVVTKGKRPVARIARRIFAPRRVAVAAYRPRRSRPRIIARSVVQLAEPAFAFPPPEFQAAAQPAPQAARRQVLVRRYAVRRAIAKRIVGKQTAIGGPFVRPPGQ
jgi:hypothetical protein